MKINRGMVVKININMNKYVLMLAVAATVWILACANVCRGQTLTVLHNFSNSDSYPTGLVLAGNKLYGTTASGGTYGHGMVFTINTDGTAYAVLKSFPPIDQNYVNNGGADPSVSLVLSDNTLYGTAAFGGTYGGGTVFKINTNGTGFAVLHNFGNDFYNGSSPIHPGGGLALSGGTLYGSTPLYSLGNFATIYAINTDGTGFTVLSTFSYNGITGPGPSDLIGASALAVSRDVLYGTAPTGNPGHGTVFSMNTDGTGLTLLHDFDGSDGTGTAVGSLVLSGNTLYRGCPTTNGAGVVYALNTDGSGFTVLHQFTGSPDGNGAGGGALIMSGTTLYGATTGGGIWTNGGGIIFKIKTDGSDYAVLRSFAPLFYNSVTSTYTNADGARPAGPLVVSGNILYGTAYQGGDYGNGTIFSITLPIVRPQLAITSAGPDVVLTWPTTPVGFTLQSTTNLAPPIAWITNSPAPVLVNGQNTVTNPISGAQQFYRLSQ
jgi:uncharacterized repeat protein (TIGR03803 family)